MQKLHNIVILRDVSVGCKAEWTGSSEGAEGLPNGGAGRVVRNESPGGQAGARQGLRLWFLGECSQGLQMGLENGRGAQRFFFKRCRDQATGGAGADTGGADITSLAHGIQPDPFV